MIVFLCTTSYFDWWMFWRTVKSIYLIDTHTHLTFVMWWFEEEWHLPPIDSNIWMLNHQRVALFKMIIRIRGCGISIIGVGMDLLKEVCHSVWAFKFQKAKAAPVLLCPLACRWGYSSHILLSIVHAAIVPGKMIIH